MSGLYKFGYDYEVVGTSSTHSTSILVKFPGDCYQSMVGVLLQGVMVGGCRVNNIQVFFI